MKKNLFVYIKSLTLDFRRGTEKIVFSDLTYFYGQMGAGKSSIARLIDYCLGGNLDFSPALQSEFVSAKLTISINNVSLLLERPRDSNSIHASWEDENGPIEIIIPARVANGIVIPNSEVEVVSDLIFYLAGVKPPKVRRSKLKESSDLSRLSFRDLLWYCYLDQDSFDSDFFHLGEDAHTYKRLKSRDVMRFILGFHQEEVAALESELQALHITKLQFTEAARSLKEALNEAEVDSEEEIIIKIDSLRRDIEEISKQLSSIRSERFLLPHGTDLLREQARTLTYEIQAIEEALPQVKNSIEGDSRHKNEIKMLGIKVQRAAAARAVLGGVSFKACPRCAQELPIREVNFCAVCGQEEPTEGHGNVSADVLEQDAKSRIEELTEAITLQKEQMKRMKSKLNELLENRQKLNRQLTSQMQDYDSAYLSNAIILERQQAQLEQQVSNLERLI